MAKINLTLSPLAQRRAAQALLGLAALMAVDVLYQIGMHMTWRHWISKQIHAIQATAPPSTQPAGKDKPSRPPELAEALRKRNIFVPVRPNVHGLALSGVIGDFALFRTQQGSTVAIKEGESGSGVRVKSIDGYDVVIEYQGKPETLHLFGPGGAGASPGGQVMASPGGEAVMMPPGATPGRIQMEAAPGGMPGGGDLSNLPPEIRQQIENRAARRRAK
jgi:hypothetical protein